MRRLNILPLLAVVLPFINGNTHFPFSDLNNLEVANLISKWLKEKKLD